MDGAGVRLARASATREPLARKEGQDAVLTLVTVDSSREGETVQCLVCNRADIAGVISVWPLHRE